MRIKEITCEASTDAYGSGDYDKIKAEQEKAQKDRQKQQDRVATR